MASPITPSLLPTGLYDLLPPQAAHERRVSGGLMEAFERFGYDQISPPLMEFEASLLAGKGAALSSQTFRVMDPYSQEMLGFRPDITMQVARIATSRLGESPRPLRICYNGNTLRVRGEGGQHTRQHRQAGIELIGDASPQADAEVLAVALEALQALGLKDLVVDLNLPGVVAAVLADAQVSDAEARMIHAAVECKDAGALATIKGLNADARSVLEALVASAGGWEKAIAALDAVKLPASAKQQMEHVKAVVSHVKAIGVDATLTLDAVENRGFEYHSAISFSLFARGVAGELGRGGRYTIPHENGTAEAATGLTLYVNTLMQVVPVAKQQEAVAVARGTTLAECRKLHAAGKITHWTAK